MRNLVTRARGWAAQVALFAVFVAPGLSTERRAAIGKRLVGWAAGVEEPETPAYDALMRDLDRR